jgi:molybdate transport system ATP-binding protein
MLCGNLQLKLDERFSLNSGQFELPSSGVTVLFGRSGSGKSTLLRAISGLDKRTRGELSVNGEIWQQGSKRLAPTRRNIGFVFQDAALFPHKNLKQNLDYGIKRLPKELSPANFNHIIERVGIADKLHRDVNSLSGGERQRVAIARALLMQPQFLFMDEPLSALDWQAKHQLLTLIEELIAEFNLPIFYITHAPAEVERLADRIVFMQNGSISSIETLQQALTRVDSPLFYEQGAVSVLFTKPQSQIEAGLRRVDLGEDSLWLFYAEKIHANSLRVRILAKDVSLAISDPKDLSIINHLKATIVELIPEAEHKILIRLELGDGQKLFAEITEKSMQRLHLEPGLKVYALIKSVAIIE